MESGANQYPLRKNMKLSNILRNIQKTGIVFLSASVVIKPTIEPIWLNLSNEYVIKLEKLLTELPKPFTADMLRKLFDQNGIQVTFPPTSHILYLFCNSWEMDEKYNLLYFATKLNKVGESKEP